VRQTAEQLATAEAKCRARWYELRDHPVQLAFVHDDVRFKLAPCGRRCLPTGTLVATPTGPRAIESLRVGDTVMGLDGPTNVTATHDNGVQEVVGLTSRGREYLAATDNHKLWAAHEYAFDPRRNWAGGYERMEVGSLTSRHRVRRVYLGDAIRGGNVAVPRAYSLGALLGDGCSRDNKSTDGRFMRFLYVSAGDHLVPEAIAAEIGGPYRKRPSANHTWQIAAGRGAMDAVPYYREWCAGRYAHEKIADWATVDTWDRATCLAFLAGIIDTDGSVYWKSSKRKELVVQIGMQARAVVDVCERIVHKYFQEWCTREADCRAKYVNGPVYTIKTTSNCMAARLLTALRPYLRKRYADPARLKHANVLPDRIGLAHGARRLAHTYDITVANDSNLYVLHDGGIVTSNSGKTERAKRKLVKAAMRTPGRPFFAAAPTHKQAKTIWWEDLKLLSFAYCYGPDAIREGELTIRLPNGASIHVMGLDEARRIEGVPWAGGPIDEVADLHADAVPLHVLPALSTEDPRYPGYKPWLDLIGVPEGLNHYYDMCERSKSGVWRNSKVYHWTSAEILSAEEIEDARGRMSARQFRQEYEAAFEGATGRIYEDYGHANTTTETLLPTDALSWMHDFNYTPLSSCVATERNGKLLIADEIVLTSAVAHNAAVEFCERYKAHANRSLKLYGDPAGRAGEKHAQQSNYTAIESYLRSQGWNVERRVKLAAPAIRDRQNAVRAKICNAKGDRTLFVNPKLAPTVHKGLSTVQLKEGSAFQEDESNTAQHITTALGYWIDREWPVLIDSTVPRQIVTPIPSHSAFRRK